MKVRIICASPHGVADGLGNAHLDGTTPDLPDDVAQILIERGQAEFVDAPAPVKGKKAPPAKAELAGPAKLEGDDV